jgi:hypothetical protein
MNGSITIDGQAKGNNSLIVVDAAATLEMHNGITLTRNRNTMSAGDGGGVVVSGSAVFNMRGGIISGNLARNGGGVSVLNNAVFNMYAGRIRNNDANNANQNPDGGGGGVFVSNNGGFIMRGGEITRNWAGRYGGGVYVSDSGTFQKFGGVIHGSSRGANNHPLGDIGLGENLAYDFVYLVFGQGHALYVQRNSPIIVNSNIVGHFSTD